MRASCTHKCTYTRTHLGQHSLNTAQVLPSHKKIAANHEANSAKLAAFIDSLLTRKQQELQNVGLLTGQADQFSSRNANFITQLLLAMADPTEGAKITLDDANQLAIEMLTAGSDTTAGGLAFALLLLAEFPDVQTKCRAEIRQQLPKLDDSTPTTSDLARLTYLEMTINETLRYVSEVPVIGRMALSDLNVGNTVVHQNDRIALLLSPNHMDPLLFPQPDTFDPELHFSEAAVAKRHKFAFCPFGSGPKHCPGQYLAMLELKTVLAYALDNFSFALDGTTVKTVRLSYATVQSPTGRVPLKITKLK